MTDKLDLKTPDMVNLNIERIAALFPHCVTESIVETQGIASLQKQIDFDLLRQELSGDIVEGPKERYRLEWPGKREAIVTANMPTTNTLRPVREDSVNFDTTENLYLEGDNLEVLKLLQESYLGKVKMIYIDPPYNTGNDFVYRDNFAQDSDEYKADSGMTDELGNRLVANPETAGRYHSDWLTMMYPRLKLARNLLTDDGVIFISIDDNEVHNLRKMCDEVFGEVNFVALFVWQSKKGGGNDSNTVVNDHEYVLCYSKDISNLKLSQIEIESEPLNCNDEKGKYRRGRELNKWGSNSRREDRPTMWFSIPGPNNEEVYPIKNDGTEGCWRFGKIKMQEFVDNEDIEFIQRENGTYIAYEKIRSEDNRFKPYRTWLDNVKATSEGSMQVRDIFEGNNIFSFPKPISLISNIISIGSIDDTDIILDFFSGSATTAHAVMQLNSEDGGNRKFIMVQLPEKTDEKSEAYKAGYKNICEIGKERIRRAGAKLAPQPPKGGVESASLSLFGTDEANSELKTQNSKLDIGFRVYRLDSSNMQDVYYRPQDYKQDMMTELFANHIKPDRTPDDLVAQVMLDWGLPLSLPIEQTTIAGKTVYKVAGNALYCCFDEGIDEAFVRALVEPQGLAALPLRIVFHDYAFTDDTAKENVRQLLKQLSVETEMRVI